MDIHITAGTYVNRGGAVKIICYGDGHVDIEPVYFENRRYRLIALTHTAAAVVEMNPGNPPTITEMAEYQTFQVIPTEPVIALKLWDNRPDNEVEIYKRYRCLSQVEYNAGVSAIYYTWIRDGAYDEQIHRHKNRMKSKY